MATPVWDRMHILFANAIRDQVANAQTNGADLSVSDRDYYLNTGYAKYVLLAYDIYQNDKELLRSLLQSFLKSASVTVVPGSMVATADISAVSDFGLGIDLASITPGVSVIVKSLTDFIQIQAATSLEVVPTLSSNYAVILDNSIQLLPATLSGTGFILTYLLGVQTFVENSATDCPLLDEHFDPIVGFALWHFYKNKQEFQIAQMYLQDAYKTAPFPLDLLQQAGAVVQ